MNQNQDKDRTAQPAAEGLKKHGDPLEKQVRDAMTPPSPAPHGEHGKIVPDK